MLPHKTTLVFGHDYGGSRTHREVAFNDTATDLRKYLSTCIRAVVWGLGSILDSNCRSPSDFTGRVDIREHYSKPKQLVEPRTMV